MMLWCDSLNVDSVTSKRKRSPGLDGNKTDEESCESEKTVLKKKKAIMCTRGKGGTGKRHNK